MYVIISSKSTEPKDQEKRHTAQSLLKIERTKRKLRGSNTGKWDILWWASPYSLKESHLFCILAHFRQGQPTQEAY